MSYRATDQKSTEREASDVKRRRALDIVLAVDLVVLFHPILVRELVVMVFSDVEDLINGEFSTHIASGGEAKDDALPVL
jgi:hypothetical protein